MLIQVPSSDRHSLVLLLIDTPAGQLEVTVMDTVKEHDVRLPAGVDETQCRVTAFFLKHNMKVDPTIQPVLVKDAEHKPLVVKDAAKESKVSKESKGSKSKRRV